MSFLEFIPPEQHGHFKSRMKKIVETGYLEPTEYTVNRKDGTSFVSESRTSLIRDPDGSPKAILSIGRDITERKRIEEEKRQLEAQYRHAKKMEAIGNLAGGIAHEFNNLLSVIMGNASVMLFGKDPNHEDYEALEDIEEAAKAASSLTSQLLGFARKEGYEVRTINLNHLVRDTFETFAKTKRQIRIHQDFAEDLAAIEADPSQLSQVLLNLFIHAADAMPDGGDLFLKTMNTNHDALAGIVLEPKPGIYVQFSITDSGAGMDRETREHIFEPFYSRTKKGSRTGLGLASVYGTIRSHGGHIALQSEQGQGTTFVIYLPASSKQVEDPVIQSKRATLSTRTILIVDDEKKVLDMAHKVIRKLGYEVLEASGGREAIEVFRSHHEEIDLVILDITMPDMGGGEVFDSLKKIDPAVHVLLASGYSVDNTAREIMARGCDGFIQKPFNMKDLHQAIETIRA
jgi:signal transduction histidine kinase